MCDQADVEEFNDGDKMHSLDSDTYTAIFQTGEYEHKFIKGYKGPLIYSLPFQEGESCTYRYGPNTVCMYE